MIMVVVVMMIVMGVDVIMVVMVVMGMVVLVLVFMVVMAEPLVIMIMVVTLVMFFRAAAACNAHSIQPPVL
jgi:hypothetical protein